MGVFFRIGVILVVILLDIMLSGYFGGSLIAPHALLMLMVAWTLVLGFSESLGWIILSGIFADMLLFRPLGFSVLIFVGASYGVSLLSKRFFIHHSSWVIFPFLGVILFSMLVEWSAILLFWGVSEGWEFILQWIYSESIIAQIEVISLNALFFFLSYRGLTRMETFLSYYKRRIEPKRYV